MQTLRQGINKSDLGHPRAHSKPPEGEAVQVPYLWSGLQQEEQSNAAHWEVKLYEKGSQQLLNLAFKAIIINLRESDPELR